MTRFGTNRRGTVLYGLVTLAAALTLGPVPAQAHDASVYGGVFRSRNAGGTWLNADTGLFLNAALTVAVDPHDPAHLLLGTDNGLLRSFNGGRSWAPEAKEVVLGAVFAATFAPNSPVILCAAPSGVFRLSEGRWERSSIPAGAAPGRTIAFGAKLGRVYLLGRSGLFESSDQGQSFVPLDPPLGATGDVTALAVSAMPDETLFILTGGVLLASLDGGVHWERRGADMGPLETVLFDQMLSGRLWTAGRGVLFASDDLGRHWRTAGRLPDSNTVVRGVAADGVRIIVTSDRGMYISPDEGRTWQLEESGLPAHIEAGPLARDPSDRRTLYAVYSLMPYPEVWRAALEGGNLLARVDATQLVAGSAFMLLLLLGGATLVRWLATPTHPISKRRAR